MKQGGLYTGISATLTYLYMNQEGLEKNMNQGLEKNGHSDEKSTDYFQSYALGKSKSRSMLT